jgi:hypothetical protein
VGWLLLAALGIMWAAFLLPSRRGSPNKSVKEFGRDMDLLADAETQGRWIVTPRKGMTFIGPRARAQVRARERRRRVLIVLVESIVLTGLIGLVPPLRAMWYATAALAGLLGLYVWMLISMKAQRANRRDIVRVREAAAPERAQPARHRYAADAGGRTPRPAINGLPTMADEVARISVKPAREVAVARV